MEGQREDFVCVGRELLAVNSNAPSWLGRRLLLAHFSLWERVMNLFLHTNAEMVPPAQQDPGNQNRVSLNLQWVRPKHVRQ